MESSLFSRVLVLVVVCCLPHWMAAQEFDWVNGTGGTSLDRGFDVATDAAGNVYAAGTWRGTVDLDPGPGTAMHTTVGTEELYLQKFDAGGNLVWVKTLSGTSNTSHGYGSKTIVVDAAGNVTLVGVFSSTLDFDPGPGSYPLTSTPNSAFIWRLDVNGDLVWAKKLSGTQSVAGRSIAQDASGNLYVTGSFMGTADLDPGAGIANVASAGNSDMYVVKLDAQGNYIWSLAAGSTSIDEGDVITLVPGGRIAITGTFTNAVDFDPGAGSAVLSSVGSYYDLFIAMYDTGGNFVWAKSAQSNIGPEDAVSIAADMNGNVFVAGNFRDTTDFDPGPGVYWLYPNSVSGSPTDMYVWSLDVNGDFRWAFMVGTNQYEMVNDIAVDADGYVYSVGYISQGTDMDPGPGVEILIPPSWPSFFVARYTNAGELNWARCSGLMDVEAAAIALATDGSMLIAGYFRDSVDFDVSQVGSHVLTSAGVDDAFILKLLQDTCASLMVRTDTVCDLSCTTSAGFATVFAMGGLPPYNYAWSTIPPQLDSIVTYNSPGTYIVTVTDAEGCMTSRGVVVHGPTIPGGWDLEAQLTAGVFVPGRQTFINANVHNDGCVPVNGVFMIVLDTVLQYVNAFPIPDSMQGDTLYWTIPSITYDSAYLLFIITVYTPSWAVPDSMVHLGFVANPIPGDGQPADNVRLDYEFPIRGSYDPNVKSVYPAGVCPENYTLMSDPLVYTIQFQNTGNASAKDIMVLDTLDADLDILTLDIKYSSHAMTTEVLQGNVLQFLFQDIYLPDSTSDEPGSHGYFVYEISARNGVASGTEVWNGSAIYFDFNPAVLTNTVLNTLVTVLPTPCPTVAVASGMDGSLRMHPNPATGSVQVDAGFPLGDIRVTNMWGQVVFQRAVVQSNELGVDVSGWASGLYFVRVCSDDGRRIVGRLVVE